MTKKKSKLEQQTEDWIKITQKVNLLRWNYTKTEEERKPMVEEVDSLLKAYNKKYNMLYDPINPPGEIEGIEE